MEILRSKDFDEFVDSVRDVDSKMLLRNVKRRIWSNAYLDLNGLHIQIGKLGSGNIAEGQSFESGYMIYLPLTDRTLYTANAYSLGIDSFAILEPGCEFSICTEDEHDWCTAFVPTYRVTPFLSTSYISHKRCRVTLAMPDYARQFNGLIHRALAAATVHPELTNLPAATTLASELLELSGAVLSAPMPVDNRNFGGRPRISRDEIIRGAKQILDSSSDALHQTNGLATKLGVSERTLHNAFREYYGIGPRRYIQLRQLQRIRQELRVAEADETRVSDVLAKNGVWEFGRFASRYKQQFGELPSDTLRARKR